MDPERYERLTDLFLEARGLEPEAREALLRDRCAGDAALEHRVRSMLRADGSDSGRLTQAVLVATDVLSRSDPGPGEDPAVEGFRIVRRIGAGGMGVVFEAEQESVRRTVALKLVRPGFATPELERRFELEGEILGRLEHPGIARVYEMGTAPSSWGDVRYFAMELVRGRPLRAYADESALDRRGRLALLAEVCDAVEHAHGKGVVHRDLKPGNVLVEADGRPRVLDFGVGRLRGDLEEGSRITRAGEIVGTLAYMSPEQVRGDAAAVDVRADVYALGAIGYELLSGRLPLDVSDLGLLEAARRIESDEPLPLGRLDPHLRGDLEAIFVRALEKDPGRRYPSASALAADLRRHLAHEPVLARPVTTVYQLRKFARRNRWIVAGVASTVLALAAGLAAALVLGARARARAAEAREALARASAVTDLFVATLESADPYGRPDGERTVAEALVGAWDRLGAEVGAHPEVDAEFRYHLAGLLLDHDRPGRAEEHAAKAVEIRGALFGPEAPRTLAARTLHARSLGNLGRQAEALAEHEAVLAARRRAGDDEAAWIDAYHVVYALRELGRLEEALALAREAHAKLLERRGPRDAETLWASCNLGGTLSLLGLHDDAIALLRDSLRIADEVRPRTDRLRLRLLRGFTGALSDGGRVEEALAAHRELVAALEEVLGPEHEDVREARSKEGILLCRLGRLEEGVAHLEAVHRDYAARHGPDARTTLTAAGNLLSAYAEAGRTSDALALSQAALRDADATFGAEHFYAGWIGMIRGEVLLAANRPEEAVAALEPALERLRGALGEEHEWSVRSALDAARAYDALGDDESGAYYRRLAGNGTPP